MWLPDSPCCLAYFKFNLRSFGFCKIWIYEIFLLVKIGFNAISPLICFFSLNSSFFFSVFFFIRVHADNNTFPFDIPGYINNSDLKTIIKEQHLILKNNILGSKKVDADNYYVQAGDLRSINLKNQI